MQWYLYKLDRDGIQSFAATVTFSHGNSLRRVVIGYVEQGVFKEKG